MLGLILFHDRETHNAETALFDLHFLKGVAAGESVIDL
jgi:hypothetical protein